MIDKQGFLKEKSIVFTKDWCYEAPLGGTRTMPKGTVFSPKWCPSGAAILVVGLGFEYTIPTDCYAILDPLKEARQFWHDTKYLEKLALRSLALPGMEHPGSPTPWFEGLSDEGKIELYWIAMQLRSLK